MTAERQAEMQRSLMAMLGDRSQPAATPTPKENAKKSRSIKLSNDAHPPPIPPAAVVMPPAPPSEGDNSTPENSDLGSSPRETSSNNNGIDGSINFVDAEDLDQWACTLCTLINPCYSEFCSACETIRPW